MTGKKASCWFRYIGMAAVTAFFFSGLFSRCANVGGQPQGGPQDTLPPRVVRMTPPYNSTNLFPSRIVIEFDEYIQLKDLQSQFFTSPFMEVKPDVTVKNRSAVIDIKSPLDSATTYVLNLGSSIADNNEGNQMPTLTYTFSTGNHIDSMFMSGFVSDALTADTVEGAYIFFYDARLDSIPATDSLLFDTWKASAVIKTLSDGGFIFPNLKPMDYRVYAMMDKNGNQIYDPGTDEVAFLDTVYNPLHMPSFMMWYDTTRMHMVAQHQLYFRSFIENADRRMNLSASSRPAAQEVVLKFSSKNPQIEQLDFRDIPPEKVMVEYPTESRDSILYWFDIPQDEIPDTLFAHLAYQRHDSVGQLYLHEQELRLIWKKPFVAPSKGQASQKGDEETTGILGRLRRRDRNRPAEQESPAGIPGEGLDSLAADSLALNPADTIPPSTMKFTFSEDSPVIPGYPPVLTFDLPVRRMETDSIRFYRKDAGATDAETVDVPLAIEVDRDSLLIRKYTLRTEWQDGKSYSLFIPPGAIETIDGERNDSITKDFQVGRKNDMGSVTLNLTGAVPEYEYIVQITDEKGGSVLREIPHLKEGTHEVEYIAKGKIKLRLMEDRNGNGKWDTGDLVKRIQPEVIAWFHGPEEGGAIDLQGAVELEEIDLTELFRPRTLEADQAEGEEDQAPAEGETPALSESGTEIVTSQARVEDFELTDPKAEKRAAKAARRAARAERKAARREGKKVKENPDHDHPEEEVIPGYELNYMKDELP